MTAAPLRPDLVVFDVDGTLHDFVPWWPRVLRAGLRRFAERVGAAIPDPSDAAACAVVGKRDIEVWGPFLPEALRARWQELRETVIPLECDELRGRRDHLFPGMRRLLAGLRAGGVRVAVASNCRAGYFAAVRHGLGLAFLTDSQLCLDSPGVACKADMVRLAVAAAGAHRPVVVGDREGDLEAAEACGVPFVWRRSRFCDLAAQAVATWEGAAEDLPRLLGLPIPGSAGHSGDNAAALAHTPPA